MVGSSPSALVITGQNARNTVLRKPFAELFCLRQPGFAKRCIWKLHYSGGIELRFAMSN